MTILRRGDLVDYLVHDGEAVLLVGERCIRLNHIATEVMEFLSVEQPHDELVHHLQNRFGAPPGRGIEDAVDELVADLAREGILIVEVGP